MTSLYVIEVLAKSKALQVSAGTVINDVLLHPSVLIYFCLSRFCTAAVTLLYTHDSNNSRSLQSEMSLEWMESNNWEYDNR